MKKWDPSTQVEDLHLGPLTTRQLRHRTPRSSHPVDPRTRTLHNQAAPTGSVKMSTGKQDSQDTKVAIQHKVQK